MSVCSMLEASPAWRDPPPRFPSATPRPPSPSRSAATLVLHQSKSPVVRFFGKNLVWNSFFQIRGLFVCKETLRVKHSSAPYRTTQTCPSLGWWRTAAPTAPHSLRTDCTLRTPPPPPSCSPPAPLPRQRNPRTIAPPHSACKTFLLK